MITVEGTIESIGYDQTVLQKILPGTEGSHWPLDVQAAVLAWEVMGSPMVERRNHRRRPYRQALLLDIIDLTSNGADSGVLLFSRDAHPWAVGFITRATLPLNACATVHIPRGDRFRVVSCTIRRCRPFIHGWHEGALQFAHRQADLCLSPDDMADCRSGGT